MPLNWTAVFFSIPRPSFTRYTSEATLPAASGWKGDGYFCYISLVWKALHHDSETDWCSTLLRPARVLTGHLIWWGSVAPRHLSSVEAPCTGPRWERARSHCHSASARPTALCAAGRLARDWDERGGKKKRRRSDAVQPPRQDDLLVDKRDLTRAECSFHEVNVFIVVRLCKCQNDRGRRGNLRISVLTVRVWGGCFALTCSHRSPSVFPPLKLLEIWDPFVAEPPEDTNFSFSFLWDLFQKCHFDVLNGFNCNFYLQEMLRQSLTFQLAAAKCLSCIFPFSPFELLREKELQHLTLTAEFLELSQPSFAGRKLKRAIVVCNCLLIARSICATCKSKPCFWCERILSFVESWRFFWINGTTNQHVNALCSKKTHDRPFCLLHFTDYSSIIEKSFPTTFSITWQLHKASKCKKQDG